MKSLALVALLAATAHAESAKRYAPLFTDGTKLAFRGTRAEDTRGTGKLTSRAVAVTCTVTHVRETADASLAFLACDKEMGALAGTYGATAKGLYRLGDADTDAAPSVAAIEATDLVMPVAPAVGKVTTGKPGDLGAREERTTKRGAGFCRTVTSLVGDMYAQRYCVARGRLTGFGADDGSSFPVVIDLTAR